MGKRLLLHIGDWKAGSTAIQDVFARNRATLAQNGVCYPYLRGGVSQLDLLVLYQPITAIRGARIRETLSDDSASQAALRAQLAEEVQSFDRVVISEERLAELGPSELAAFLDHMADLGFSDIAAVYYVREPSFGYLSRSAQYLKRTAELDDPHRFRPGYADSLERWRLALGSRLFVRPFDADRLVGGDVVADFLAVAKDWLPTPVAPTQGPRLNPRPSAETLVVLQRFHRWLAGAADRSGHEETRGFLHALRHTAPRRRPTEARPSAALHAAIRRSAAPDLAYVRDVFGIELDVPMADPAACPTPKSADIGSLLASYDPVIAAEIERRAWASCARGHAP